MARSKKLYHGPPVFFHACDQAKRGIRMMTPGMQRHIQTWPKLNV
jgi:hypothetical protein